ncbi:hypothetical protein GH714_005878 [Hevea brasiliensis]|uniref:Eukaryotic translation initiation factor 3 large subunit n=1 Tax=Hevea brasiliensis TaxID=3981 RepID=A0A6A6KHA7_HEVBR|nr:hypothetical protein GH714_005878 [Hevea brasiliensis]
MTAHRAFQFCKQYKRTTEFRRLCEIIRNHLANLNKYRDQRDRPDLSTPESLQLYLDTRFEQLKVATELELWQEAFRSIEYSWINVHGQKTPKPSLMVVYYAKLTEIFWISSSHLYHAYAWFKLFTLQKSFNKNLSQKDLQLIASSVVLAALAVAPYDRTHGASHLELENEKERNLRMANLIGLSRSFLLSELVSKGVLSCATQEVKDIYHLLEHEFLPLDLAAKVLPLLTKISKLGGKLTSASSVPEVQLSQYIPALEKLATLRLLQQVSQVYQMMKIESLSQMIPFFDFSVVEKISVDSVKHNFTSLKVDHMKSVILFTNVGLESDGLRDHLTIFAESLNNARAMIYPPAKNSSKLGEILPGLAEIVDKEHKRLLARKSIIEKRKEEQNDNSWKWYANLNCPAYSLVIYHAEIEQRKNQRILQEIEQRELEEAQALLEDVDKRSKRKGGKKPILEGAKVTKQTIMERALNEQLRERQEMEKKLQKLAKTMDYLERAKREEAAPLIEAAFQQQLVEEKAVHERAAEVELSRQHHDGDLREKIRLSRMLDNKMIFQERVVSRRQTEFDRQRAMRGEKIKQIIQARKQEREAKRKKIFYVRSEEERLRKLREEEEAHKREEAERRRKEEAERKAKLDEIAEKQRQRERELEEKEKLRREALLGRTTDGPSEFPAGSLSEPGAAAAAAAAAAAPSPGKYVPRFRREREGSDQASPDSDRWSGGSSRQASDPERWSGGSTRQPPADAERWGSGGTKPPSDTDRWGSGGTRQPRADSDRWGIGTRPEDRNPPGDRWRSSSSKSTWSSSRPLAR